MRVAAASLLVALLCAGVSAGGPAAADTGLVTTHADAVPVWRLNDAPRAGHVAAIGGNQETLVLVLGDGRVLHSRDRGAGWAAADAPPLAEPRIDFDPTTPSRGYIAAVGGVWRTSDHGATWTHVLDIERAPRIDVSSSGRLAAGARTADGANTVLLSHDHGETWTDLRAPIPDDDPICGVAFGPHDHLVTAMTDRASWHSPDGGATWHEATGKGLDYAVEPDGTIWRIDMGRLDRSRDGGATWTEVSPPGVGTTIASHPDGGLYLAANTGLLVTRDDGMSWTNLGHGDLVFDATRLLADPAAPDAVWVTDTVVGLARIARDTNGSPWYDGRSVQALPPAPVHDVVALDDGRTLAVGPTGLFLRDDAWRHTGAGLGTVSVLHEAAASTDGTHLYAAGQDVTGAPAAVFSHDGGRTFTVATLGPTGVVTALAVDPHDPAHALAALAGTGVRAPILETRDGGLTWSDISAGGLPVPVRAIAWDARGAVLASDAGALLLRDGVLAPLGTEPLALVAAGDGRVAAAGWTAHWLDVKEAPVPAMKTVERDAPVAAADMAIAAGKVWLLGSGLSRCPLEEDLCGTVTVPVGATAVAPHDDGRVYLAADDGLYSMILL